MKNLTEIVADAFGESSHLIRFHQITRALSLHGACSGNEQPPGSVRFRRQSSVCCSFIP